MGGAESFDVDWVEGVLRETAQAGAFGGDPEVSCMVLGDGGDDALGEAVAGGKGGDFTVGCEGGEAGGGADPEGSILARKSVPMRSPPRPWARVEDVHFAAGEVDETVTGADPDGAVGG